MENNIVTSNQGEKQFVFLPGINIPSGVSTTTPNRPKSRAEFSVVQRPVQMRLTEDSSLQNIIVGVNNEGRQADSNDVAPANPNGKCSASLVIPAPSGNVHHENIQSIRNDDLQGAMQATENVTFSKKSVDHLTEIQMPKLHEVDSTPNQNFQSIPPSFFSEEVCVENDSMVNQLTNCMFPVDSEALCTFNKSLQCPWNERNRYQQTGGKADISKVENIHRSRDLYQQALNTTSNNRSDLSNVGSIKYWSNPNSVLPASASAQFIESISIERSRQQHPDSNGDKIFPQPKTRAHLESQLGMAHHEMEARSFGDIGYKGNKDLRLLSLKEQMQNGFDPLQPKERYERIDLTKLPIVENPLQWNGLSAVVEGRLGENSIYYKAAENLGYIMVSHLYIGLTDYGDEDVQERNFITDLQQFWRERHFTDLKVPVIENEPIDMFLLTKEVLLLKGYNNVVEKRGFTIVARQLELPISSINISDLLRIAYEKLLVQYEEQLLRVVWTQSSKELENDQYVFPKESEKKRAPSASREERHENVMKKTRNQENPDDRNELSWSFFEKGELDSSFNLISDVEDVVGATTPTLRGLEKRNTTIKNGNREELFSNMIELLDDVSNDPCASIMFINMVQNFGNTDICVPSWALSHNITFSNLVEESQRRFRENEVRNAPEVVMVAISECLAPNSDGGNGFRDECSDLGLAHLILKIRGNERHKNIVNFVLQCLVDVCGKNGCLLLRKNKSSRSLMDALWDILHEYARNLHLRKQDQATDNEINPEEDPAFEDLAFMYQISRSASFVLGRLSTSKENYSEVFCEQRMAMISSVIIQERPLCQTICYIMVKLLELFLRWEHGSFNQSDLYPLIDHLLDGLRFLCNLGQENGNAGAKDSAVEQHERQIINKLLNVMELFLGTHELNNDTIEDLSGIVTELLHSYYCATNIDTLSMIVCNLLENYPKIVCPQNRFIQACLLLLEDSKQATKISQLLQALNQQYPLDDEVQTILGLDLPKEVVDDDKIKISGEDEEDK